MGTDAKPPVTPSFPLSAWADQGRVAPSPAAFRLLLLGAFTIAAALGAEGVQTFAEMRERHFAILARLEAAAPVPYLTHLPALHAQTPARGGELRVWIRADSAGVQADALCAWSRTGKGRPEVRWIARSPTAEPCISDGGLAVRSGGAAAAELAAARVIVLDSDGRTLYSSAQIPAPADLHRVLTVLEPIETGRVGERR